jgi:hypothetical protein
VRGLADLISDKAFLVSIMTLTMIVSLGTEYGCDCNESVQHGSQITCDTALFCMGFFDCQRALLDSTACEEDVCIAPNPRA